MSPEQAVAREIINLLDERVFFVFIQFFLIGVLFVVSKTIIEGISAYLMLITDKFIAQGQTQINIFGCNGRILKIGWRVVVIETKEGFFRIPTKEFKNTKYKLLKVELAEKNRRKDDKVEEKEKGD